jgi:hypothetical protein
MKTLRTLFVIAIAIVGFTTNSFAQDPVIPGTSSVNDAKATATILKPITMTKDHELQFGTFGSDGAASKTVSVDASGNRTGSAVLYDVAQTPVSSATFKVEGTPDATFHLALPTANVQLNGKNGVSGTLTINTGGFVTNLATGSIGTLGHDGKFEISVGATLQVPQSSPAGQYEGTYSVSVNYN